MRPGITGLAQVRTRTTAPWDERIVIDNEYVDKFNVLFDLKIIFKTIAVVIKHSDIGQGNEIPESFHVVRQAEWEKEKEFKK